MATMISVDRRPQANYATRARWATVRIETAGNTYVGRIYVPETKKRLSDVLSDERLFINLTEVSVNNSPAIDPFVAINKQYVRTIRIIDETEVETRPTRMS
jgi:uncharacterized protein DUF6812